jgi:hypothetical protein
MIMAARVRRWDMEEYAVFSVQSSAVIGDYVPVFTED